MVKLTLRDRESVQEAVRRFRKLVERSGIKKEMRRREYYEKPSEVKRRSRLRAERRATRAFNERRAAHDIETHGDEGGHPAANRRQWRAF